MMPGRLSAEWQNDATKSSNLEKELDRSVPEWVEVMGSRIYSTQKNISVGGGSF